MVQQRISIPGVVPQALIIPPVGSVCQLRHGRWHPALQEHKLGFFPGQEPLPPHWGDPVLVPTFFSFYSSSVLFFGIPFLGSIILVRTTISSPGTPEVKPKSFRPKLQPQRDTFVFDNRLWPLLATPHVEFARSLAHRCVETPKDGRSAALPTYSTSTSLPGQTFHSRAGVRVARCGSAVATLPFG